jgi:hypothetical protein
MEWELHQGYRLGKHMERGESGIFEGITAALTRSARGEPS